ncbi:MAG: bifunctional proline dehydrogenase/L-glutamate gamma-semialdehyde dehydrogenase PutA [Rhodobacteraceae bacterium]|jgi:RHH-type proline utilization regulon transcriptional repressor/proline dehydrogenase/delta 1-pyrroline-5-carboxylate dehydrogenase|nr:bifunctional proline dehydrogenase/L-glutamate gamma-semialdehyde dehydrogenase PutA [Paracoccaceae bacterium]
MTETAAADPWTVLAHGARAGEAALLARLEAAAGLDGPARAAVAASAAALVVDIRAGGGPGLMEALLAEYGLSTEEGVALMCLAEALLRVPDPATVDALIEDKIAPSDWGRHLGRSSSPLVNASTWALMLTGRVLEEGEPGIAGRLRGALRRLGEPVIRAAVGRAMREMGRQFVLGETIAEALARARAAEAEGYRFSYDMLGEAARTEADARRYMLAYSGALAAIAGSAAGGTLDGRPGLSVKLSALHPRFEIAQRARVLDELVPRLRALMLLASDAGLGLTVDAEEQERLVLGFEVVRTALEDPALRGWDGAGMVVQAYGRRAPALIAALDDLAAGQRRRLMVRLVKGAYWDSEVKRAQLLGLPDYPVFTRKAATDVAYLGCARLLLAAAPRLYPQFATHNAHSIAAVLAMAPDRGAFEFQRLHGMGERLHALVKAAEGTAHRVYAPVGAHRDLLAYLVRRLLENGANSSFVHRIVDARVPPVQVAACPFAALDRPAPPLVRPPDLYLPHRANARGWDLADAGDLGAIKAARTPFHRARFAAGPILAVPAGQGPARPLLNPAEPGDIVGHAAAAGPSEVDAALAAARPWAATAAARAAVLAAAAAALEHEPGPVLALLAREAGKTLPDAVAELREAADALRYHAAEAAEAADAPPLGTIACISPWNFPLAIFAGQIAAALAAGNAVLAKPAEQTPLVAAEAVRRLHAAGVPATALQLLPGEGPVVGAALVTDPRVAGVMFTGSTGTARTIARTMAGALAPGAPLIAETGGINAMIVDSTALPEQAVRDIIASAFQSAGQRCSALRCLYLQEEVAGTIREMLFGAMDTLTLGDPWELSTDVGPVIDAAAASDLAAYVAAARAEGRVLKELAAPAAGCFVPPVVIGVRGIGDIPREVFGPVLHLATFRADALEGVIEAINASGHGLTFGMHSRIDDRVQAAVAGVRAGNLYVNRNQIGAVVGVQPFGGEGLSGTGPKAGGPHLLARLRQRPAPVQPPASPGEGVDNTAAGPPPAVVQALLDAARPPAGPLRTLDLPGPTGESNRLSLHPRAPFLCLGPGPADARAQVVAVRALGGAAVAAPGLAPEELAALTGFSGVLHWGPEAAARALARALAARDGPILPLVTGMPDIAHACHERHVCIDTTASGGNAALLAAAAE